MKILPLLAVAACLQLACAASVGQKTRQVPRFALNLDLPPKQRWTEIMSQYADELQRLLVFVRSLVTSEVLDLLAVVGLKVETAFPYPYNYEIMGIAELLKGVSMGDVILGNVLYELTAFGHGSSKACTSIVAEATNGTIFHGRNLDYSIGKYLRNLTITVDFQSGGQTVYTGTTFAGFIGLLTGQKPHGFTISLDERDRGQVWMNALEALGNGASAVAGFRIRDALGSDEMDYEKALVFLADKPLIAPCYIIIGGTRASQGAVITRDRIAVLDFWKLDAEKGRWYVLETNYDHWEAPPTSDDRRDPGMKSMNEMGRGHVNMTNLFNVLSTPPVLNNRTTYTVVMSAAHPERYSAWIWDLA